jgi:diguanylate cyclase (GGDEF)-like protein
MMAGDLMIKIVERCLSLEETAILVYRELAAGSHVPEIRRFWIEMSQEEATHMRFWRRLKEMGRESSLPEVFENPEEIYRELTETGAKIQALLGKCKDRSVSQDAFVVACRLEFYLLHPSLSMFFHAVRAFMGEENLEKAYEAHLNCLIDMITQYGPQTPELEIIGEALQRVWKENKAFAEQAFSDGLTDLLNRRGFLKIAEHLTYLARRRQEPIGLLMIDIDNLKQINDQLGHERGDQALVLIGREIKSSVRASDLVCRYGGEEFVVFLFGTDLRGSHIVGEKIRAAVEHTSFRAPLTVSVGVVASGVTSPAAPDIQDLIRRADHALDMAKQTGKNRVVGEIT